MERNRPSPFDILGLPRELGRLADILREIGPGKISTFLDDVHQISAIAKNDPTAFSKLIEALRDFNILFGGFIGRGVGYKGYTYLDGTENIPEK